MIPSVCPQRARHTRHRCVNNKNINIVIIIQGQENSSSNYNLLSTCSVPAQGEGFTSSPFNHHGDPHNGYHSPYFNKSNNRCMNKEQREPWALMFWCRTCHSFLSLYSDSSHLFLNPQSVRFLEGLVFAKWAAITDSEKGLLAWQSSLKALPWRLIKGHSHVFIWKCPGY